MKTKSDILKVSLFVKQNVAQNRQCEQICYSLSLFPIRSLFESASQKLIRSDGTAFGHCCYLCFCFAFCIHASIRTEICTR